MLSKIVMLWIWDVRDIHSRGQNKRYVSHFIKERLDRVLCNKNQGKFFYELLATNLVSWGSNHNPIVMEVNEITKVWGMYEVIFLECTTKTCGALMMRAKRLLKRNGADLEEIVV